MTGCTKKFTEFHTRLNQQRSTYSTTEEATPHVTNCMEGPGESLGTHGPRDTMAACYKYPEQP